MTLHFFTFSIIPIFKSTNLKHFLSKNAQYYNQKNFFKKIKQNKEPQRNQPPSIHQLQGMRVLMNIKTITLWGVNWCEDTFLK